MQQINDFFMLLNNYLSRQQNIQQCIIKDYVSDENGNATCTAILPNVDGRVKEYKNIVCYIGSAVDITFDSYMQGILFKIPNRYSSGQKISQQSPILGYDYFSLAQDNVIAIIIPHSETLSNILTINLNAKESFKAQAPKCYVGDTETNVLNELSEYLSLLKDYFTQVAQAAPTIASIPAGGAAQLAQSSTEIAQKTDEIYQKITKITS